MLFRSLNEVLLVMVKRLSGFDDDGVAFVPGAEYFSADLTGALFSAIVSLFDA